MKWLSMRNIWSPYAEFWIDRVKGDNLVITKRVYWQKRKR